MDVATRAIGHRVTINTYQLDVAGINGNFDETWTNYSPDLPRPDGTSNYDYRYLWRLGDRFYSFFASDNSGVTWDVYGYSWAPGETDWTQEFSGAGAGADYDLGSWDAAFDGTSFYVAFTTTITVTVDCGGGITHPASSTVTLVYGGTTAGTWALLESVYSESFDHSTGAAQGTLIKLCASVNDVGNCYLAGSEGGASPCASNLLQQFVWVIGIGSSPTVGVFNGLSGEYDRVYVREGRYDTSALSGEVQIARITDFDLVNDGDDVQLICRIPENFGGTHEGFNKTLISVFKPGEMQTAQEGETHHTSGTGWDLFYEAPAFEFDTFTAFTKIVTPCWTETSGRKQRAIVSVYDDLSTLGDFTDIRGLDANGLELHELHDNVDLDSTRLYTPLGAIKNAGVGASVDPVIGGGDYYTPGIYYDTTGDEYWALYQDFTSMWASVATRACGLERWVGFPFHAHGFSGNLQMGQGPFFDDAFYVIAIPDTTTPTSHARVIKVPICRGCMECSFA